MAVASTSGLEDCGIGTSSFSGILLGNAVTSAPLSRLNFFGCQLTWSTEVYWWPSHCEDLANLTDFGIRLPLLLLLLSLLYLTGLLCLLLDL